MTAFPGPHSRTLLNELNSYVISDPWPFAIDLALCSGMDLMTVDGQRIRDWAGLYGSRLLGWNHPRLRTPAMIERLALTAINKTTNPDLVTSECVAYYRLLHRQLAPRCMRNPHLEVYVVNSGAEAVENLMKYFINRHLHAHPLASARRFIVFDQGFHGRTVYALNATHLSHDVVLTRGFHGLATGNLTLPFPACDADAPAAENAARTAASLAAVERALGDHGDEIAGIIVEPLQGAGGQRVAEPAFFRGLSQLAQRYGTCLGFDEVQTAGGNCGAIFVTDMFDLPYPVDGIATAKKFGCGVVYMHHPLDDHGVLDSTWGGSLVDMVRVVEEFAIVADEALIAQVPAKTAQLVQGLKNLQKQWPHVVRNVRGLGLYQGWTCPSAAFKADLIERALQEQSLLLLGAGSDGIRLRPPLDVNAAAIADLLLRLSRLLSTAG